MDKEPVHKTQKLDLAIESSKKNPDVTSILSVLSYGLVILCLATYFIDIYGYEYIFSNPSDANELLQQRRFQDN